MVYLPLGPGESLGHGHLSFSNDFGLNPQHCVWPGRGTPQASTLQGAAFAPTPCPEPQKAVLFCFSHQYVGYSVVLYSW